MTPSGLLIDNSAWARLDSSRLSGERATEIGDALDRGELITCLPFLLEAGYSARSAQDYVHLMKSLSALPGVSIDEETERRAIDAQGQLARVGHQRVTPVDVIIAATADRHSLDVLHYDGHFDTIAQRTDLRFESVWLAPPGSLER